MRTRNPPVLLKGRLLIVVRFASLILATTSIVVFILAIPFHHQQLLETCTGAGCNYNQLTPQEALALQRLGFSPSHYSIYVVAISIVLALVYSVIAFIIFLRQPREWIALLTALWMVTFGTINDTIQPLVTLQPVIQPLVQFLHDLGRVLLLPIFLLAFPDGRFFPHWTKWLFILFLVSGVVGPVIVENFPQADFERLSQLMWFSMMLVGIGSQVYRYRKISDQAQRLQTKWVVSGLLIVVLGLFGWSVLLNFRLPTLTDKIIELTLVTSLFSVVALTLGISILRYRLWDIDVIIRRTLIYTTLTAALALVYAGSVVVLQGVFQAFTGSTNPSQFAIVVSTLAVAALFSPLRRRVQERIDRRFYRSRYDAERILEDFADTARRETDLETLTGELIEAVQSSLQPERVYIWLKEVGRENKVVDRYKT